MVLERIFDTRAGIDHLKMVIISYGLREDILELLEYWESLDEDTLRARVVRDIDTLQAQFNHFVKVTRPRRLASSPHYRNKIPRLTTSKRLSYLYESLKEPSANLL